VRKEVELREELEFWALSSLFFPQQWNRCQLLGVRVVWQEHVLGSAWGFPMSEEGEMLEEPSQLDEYTIQGWKEPC
jgi:hypothetical protein